MEITSVASGLLSIAAGVGSVDNSQNWKSGDWPWAFETDASNHWPPNFLPFFARNPDFFETQPWETSPGSGVMRSVGSKVQKAREIMYRAGVGTQFDAAIDLRYPYGFDTYGNPRSFAPTGSLLGSAGDLLGAGSVIAGASSSSSSSASAGSAKKASLSVNLVGVILMVGVFLSMVFYFLFGGKKSGRRSAWVVIAFVFLSSVVSAQTANNGVRQLQADWTAVKGVQSILHKPSVFPSDTVLMATRARLKKVGDSLGALISSSSSYLTLGAGNKLSPSNTLYSLWFPFTSTYGTLISKYGIVVGDQSSGFIEINSNYVSFNSEFGGERQYLHSRINTAPSHRYLPVGGGTLADSASTVQTPGVTGVTATWGVFTPTIVGGVYVIDSAFGYYEKVGPKVVCNVFMHASSADAGQSISIGGFPFPFSTSTAKSASSSFNAGSVVGTFCSYPGTNYGFITANPNNLVPLSLAQVFGTGGRYLRFVLTYFID